MRYQRILAAIMAALVVASPSMAGAIKVWSNGENITAIDLNATLAHLHANLGHGHGAVIINSDISSSAAIAHTKLATPALLPKLWASIGASACASTPCTLVDSSGVTSVTRSGAGVYSVTFTARANVNYGALVTSHISTVMCYVNARTTTTAAVLCFDSATGATPTDSSFTFLMMDSDN